jgi:hypothetical protein
MDSKLDREVRRRAGDRCEYCHTPQSTSTWSHWFDHIIPEKHHGATTLENLALCCRWCNWHKGTNLSGIDPLTARVTTLFNPRAQTWHEHFQWRGGELAGLTDVGRATIDVLCINLPDRVQTRLDFLPLGIFPRDFE